MTTSTAAALHELAFALVRDAQDLMDATDPGATVIADHPYGPTITLRARRVYSPQHDSLTLIAYHGEQLVAAVIATHTGARLTARIHQMRVAGMLFTRHSDWSFLGRPRIAGQRRRFLLTASRPHGWTLDANGEQPTTTWPTLAAAADHITTSYPPAG